MEWCIFPVCCHLSCQSWKGVFTLTLPKASLSMWKQYHPWRRHILMLVQLNLLVSLLRVHCLQSVLLTMRQKNLSLICDHVHFSRENNLSQTCLWHEAQNPRNCHGLCWGFLLLLNPSPPLLLLLLRSAPVSFSHQWRHPHRLTRPLYWPSAYLWPACLFCHTPRLVINPSVLITDQFAFVAC